MPKAFRQFNYDTITEVILSISYTAEFDGALRDQVESSNAAVERSLVHWLSNNSTSRLFSFRQDFSTAFTRLLNGPIGTPVNVAITDRLLPAFLRASIVRDRPVIVTNALILLRTKEAAVSPEFQIVIDGDAVGGFAAAGRPGGLPGQELPSVFRNSF